MLNLSAMMIRKYNLISMPFFAFFSKRAYRDVARNWKGVNFAYLFLLLAACCIPPTLSLRDEMVNSLDQGQSSLINQIPDIRIDDGRVIVDQTAPIYITRQDGSPAIIIDTTGSMNYIDDEQVLALLTESALIVRRGEKAFNTLDLSNITDFHINQHIANQWLLTAKGSIAPLSYGIFLMTSYVFAVMVMLLAAVVGLILSLAMRGTLNFASALRVATVAATPSIILITVSAAVGFTMPSGIHLALTLVYLVIGVSACCTKEAQISKTGQVDLKSLLNEDASSRKAA
jgi:hypothetical protein